MESSETAQCTPPFVEDLPLRGSARSVLVELPRHHHPTRLNDIAEDAELEFEDDSSCDAGSVSSRHEEDCAKLPDDESKYPYIRKTHANHWDLLQAITKGDIDLVKDQLEGGVEVEDTTYEGMIPLGVAIEEDQVEIVELLLARGASVNHRSKNLPYLVHALMKPKHGLHLVKLLLDHGATLNAISGPDQKNALHWAAAEGKAEVVDFLISRGMDIKARCSRGRTPLVLAAEAGHEDVVKVLWAQGADLEEKSEYRSTALIWAACKGKMATLKFLLEKGANVNHQDSNGHSKF
jgi:ankyrin repeat protein